MSRILKALTETARQPAGKYSIAVAGYAAPDLDSADQNGDVEKVIVMKRSHVVLTLTGFTLLVLLSLGLSLRTVAEVQQGIAAGTETAAFIVGQEQKMAALHDEVAAWEAKQARDNSALKKDIRTAQAQTADLRKELSETVVESNIFKMRIADLATAQEDMVGKMVDLSNEQQSVKNILQGIVSP